MATKIKRVTGGEAIEQLPEILPHLVFLEDEEEQCKRYALEFARSAKEAPDTMLVVVAYKDEELVGFTIATLFADCVYVSQAWSKPGNSFRIADEMFLRVMLWAQGLGRKSVRAETHRNTEGFFARFGFVERSKTIERKIEPEFFDNILAAVRVVKNG